MTVLVDTDVLIWHLRGHDLAARRLNALPVLAISAVTYFELVQGMRNKAELAAVKEMLRRRNARVLPLTEAITDDAAEMMESFALSHGLRVADALIAGTARVHKLALLTGNVKHFAAIDGLRVEVFAP